MQLADPPTSFQRPDGVWVHHIRQSDVNRFRKCPELHRRDMLDLVPDHEGDAALIGTAAHAGVALALSTMLDQVEPSIDECMAAVTTTLLEGWRAPTLRQMQIKSEDEALRLARDAFLLWWQSFLLEIDPDAMDAVELPFDVLAWSDPYRRVYLAGTMDLRMRDRSVIDWKFPGDRYGGSNGWKHERYDNQPTHYLWASELLAGRNPLLHAPEGWQPGDTPVRDMPLPDFTYGVVVRGKGVAEELEVRRTYGDVAFYRTELEALCMLIEAKLDRWPMNPSDWWCSDKWCPVWDSCRGLHMKADPWGLMRKVAELTGTAVATPVVLDVADADTDHDEETND